MTIWIKQSSTQHALRFFLVQSSDHITGLTGASPTVKLGKAGGTGAAPSGAVTEIDSTNLPGWYKVAANATDTNTLGSIDIHATATSADPCDVMDAAFIVPFDPTDAVRMGLTGLANATPGAAGGLLIAGANVATTFNGTAASGATPATAGLIINGGAASTTGGGVAAPAILATGGAGAASTNGAAIGVQLVGGGTNTVASAAHGLQVLGTSTGSGLDAESGSGATGDGIKALSNATNGNGITGTKTGSGKDLNATSTPLTLAKTTNITGFNDLTAAAAATGVWQDATAGDFTVASSIGKSLYTSGNAPGAASGLALVGSNMGTVSSVTGAVGSVTNGVTLAAAAIDSASIAASGKNAIADAILDRDMSTGTDSGTEIIRTTRQALRVLRNKVDIPNGKVKKEDDATDSWTFATTTAAGNPVTVVDPT